MSFADANRASIRVIEESEWGLTPTSGATREVRLTSSSLTASKETTSSDELRADRMVSAISETSASSGGDINFEFSAGAQDEFLAAFLMGAWTRPMTRDLWRGSTISVSGPTEITVSGQDVSAYLEAGHRIKLRGFADAANNGYFEIASVSVSGGSTTITVVDGGMTASEGKPEHTIYDANDVVILNDTTIEATADGFTGAGAFADGAAAGQLVVGQNIQVDGFSNASGTYTITSITDDTITTLPAPTVEAAGEAITVKGSMVRNPGEVSEIMQRMFTVETGFHDVGQYEVQDGMVPGTYSLEVSTGSIITGTIGFQGRKTEMKDSTVLGDTGTFDVLDSPSGEVVNATTNVGELTKNGSEFEASIQSLSLSGESNLRQQAAVGSKFAKGIGAGRFNLTGSMTVYFESAELFNNFLNHDTVSLSFEIIDEDGQMYIFTLPAIKISSDEVAPGGIDQDVMDNVEFSAFRDPTTECMLQVDRFSPLG